MNRRALLLAPFVFATKAEAAGVHLSGRLDATDSERTEHRASFGKAFSLVVQDKALWNALVPMLGAEVNISIFTV